MSRFLQLSLLAVVVILMLACIFSNSAAPTASVFSGETTAVGLAVQAQPTTFTSAGEQINFGFVVTNNSTSALAGPAAVATDKITVTCPNVNTVGNNNNNLDPGESLTCTSTYSITAGDITAGSLEIVSTASIGGLTSNTVTTRVQLAENKVLTITTTANPPNYNAANQQLTLTYTIRNTGATGLGPAQFLVRDALIPNPINCGTNATIIGPGESITCNAVYTTTSTDAAATQITSSATASGAGAGTVQAAALNIPNTLFGGGSAPGNYTKGSTIQHDVVDGEWMMQIARCYGANIDATLKANPQVVDPDVIFPTNRVTVPNVGSVATAYGPPCVKFYTVKSGDTWQSIASDPAHDAAVDVLMEANRNVSLTNGQRIKIPVHSRSYGSSVPAPTTPVPGNQPIRLTFPAGANKVTHQGNISTPQTIRHVFAATAGQTLTVKLTTPANDVNLGIVGPNAAALKASDLTNSWTGTLTATGDHFIDLNSASGAATKQYTLEVTLTSPTPAGPVERVADINPGSGDSNVSHLRSYNGQLYFRANAGDGVGGEFWRYDAGLNAVSRVADINPGEGGSEIAFLTPFGDLLYFRANGNDNGGSELWRFNGSAVGRVTDINSGTGDANPMYLTVFNNALYFNATGSDGKGSELWQYDGNTATRVTDINPDTGDSNPSHLAVFNNALYFSATSIDGGTELWTFDGTTPTRVADINQGAGNSNPAFLTVFNNTLYFSANGNDNTGTELWKFDGTNPPSRATDINVGPGDSAPTFLTVFNNALYFGANGDAAGFELWKFDGTNASRVADINPAGNSEPAFLTVHNNELYFRANGGDGAGAELWKFKGP